MSQKDLRPSREAVAEDELQYGHGPMTQEELESRFPNRPRNHGKTFFFHDLFMSLFDPLENTKKKKTGPLVARAKQGPHGPANPSPAQMKENIIERFISRWRTEVGNDFYPAIRLICPDQDRDRPMYGLKEKAIGKLLVKLLKISANSEDGYNLLNWKLPGKSGNRMAGDFPTVCFDILQKRAIRNKVGDMSIAEVNEMLDRLAAAQKENDQLPIFNIFYNRMNASELMWLIRIILRQMKIGASERTMLDAWHPDGLALFNVSSSLRRVCWELTDPSLRLEDDTAPRVELMQCFKPELAQFSAHSFPVMLRKMGMVMGDKEANQSLYIEEKLDGERIQMHMVEDPDIPGGFRFSFWSRHAKDYTYLYGNGFKDENSSLTRFIKKAFEPRLRNIILDGEMITWDPEKGVMVAFGTLKTAALGQQRNVFDDKGMRPVFRVFDCLYLNDTDITGHSLRDRRGALEAVITDVHERIEIHKSEEVEYDPETSAQKIEAELRKVIEERGEGLVLKNPNSTYRMNERNDNWMKVKPEYMMEFGESLDCLIIGGYYGQGHRGGGLASFLCGLRVDQNAIQSQGVDPMKFYSFFKVGGGFRAADYAQIKHHTEGKWHDWDSKYPPTTYIELAGPDGNAERPDVWIMPNDSVVVEVKAASVDVSKSFRTNFTLRFPRFKRLRMDKDWETALTRDEFIALKARAEEEAGEKKMTVDGRRKTISRRLKKEIRVAGNDTRIKTPYAGPETKVFDGLTFCVLTDMVSPMKKTKGQLEQIIKSNGGALTQNPRKKFDPPDFEFENPAMAIVICIADKNTVKVASLIKQCELNLVRPVYILDAVKQAEIDGPGRERLLIPLEPKHMFTVIPGMEEEADQHIDMFGDSYARDTDAAELKKVLDEMVIPKHSGFSSADFLSELETRGKGVGELPASFFRGCVAWLAPHGQGELPDEDEQMEQGMAQMRFRFAGGIVVDSEVEEGITHVVVVDYEPGAVKEVWQKVTERGGKLPRMVRWTWLRACWNEKTLLDEERYALDA